MSSLKTCIKCSKDKPISDFYKHKQMSDGHLNKCKKCCCKDTRENRKNNIDYYRNYDLIRGNRQGYDYIKKRRDKYPNQYKAHTKVRNALRNGKIARPNKCSKCGDESYIVAHHDDYLKPLDVTWLCQPCHVQWHKDNGEGLNR